MTYTNYPRGSEWRKWDLHIHTPETKKNDQFTGSTVEEKWENYINSINNSTEEISVIGVTDYLSVDNYFKFKSFVQAGKVTKKFDMIIPNVELRVLPVTGTSTPVNIHCLFNPILADELETRFFSKINVFAGRNFSAQKAELRSYGKSFPGKSELNDEDALKYGISKFVIELSELRNVFKGDIDLRENTIIVVSNNSKDGASGVTLHADYFEDNGSQLDGARWNIYKIADAIFSSNPKDIDYFVGEGVDKKKTVLQKCGTLMPCFHGCDAHDNAKIFVPTDNRFCWIKADPTFEGLKQTLYEPNDRVKIQAIQPDLKNDRFVISKLEFIDSGSTFGNKKILLNDNLNSIIGGKSSGKSLLMYVAAKSIDPEQVEKTSQRLNFEGYKLPDNIDFQVTWKNDEIDKLSDDNNGNKNHKIIYIPQLYINHLVEKNNKDDLNILIENILLQDGEFRTFYESTQTQIGKIASELGTLLANYLGTRQRIIEHQTRSKELGKSASIQTGIETLRTAIAAGHKSSNLNEEEFKSYNELLQKKAAAEAVLKLFTKKEEVLDSIQDELNTSRMELLGDVGEIDSLPLRGKVDLLLDSFTVVPDDVQAIVNKLRENFEELNINFKVSVTELDLENKKAFQKQVIDEINELLKPFLDKIAGQQELQKLVKQLEGEQNRHESALTLEKNLQAYLVDWTNIRGKMVQLMHQRHALYLIVKEKINKTRNNIGNGITLDCKLLYRQEKLPLYHQVNRAATAGDNIFHALFAKDGLVEYSQVIELFSKPLRVVDGKLLFENEPKNALPLKNQSDIETILRGFLEDHFVLDYTVSYKGDDLLNMSPGKKGTVLLILFLQINSSQYPIFIDQPEDNLDNRTIYDLLCTMIRTKKKERQILIVSHNANLVIATDSENIIVANQEGQDNSNPTSKHKFEYVNGSLEHSFEKNGKIAQLLMQQGIKQHSCDILEGGNEAFKQRERKYSIK